MKKRMFSDKKEKPKVLCDQAILLKEKLVFLQIYVFSQCLGDYS